MQYFFAKTIAFCKKMWYTIKVRVRIRVMYIVRTVLCNALHERPFKGGSHNGSY